jgi:hypothetical protein
MIDIREMFPSYRWRWTADHEPGKRFDPYHVEIHGRYGSVYLHGTKGGVTLQAQTDRRLIRGRLAALPGVTVHQWGDDEATVTFGVGQAPPVFALLRCRRKAGNGRFPDSARRKDAIRSTEAGGGSSDAR